MPLHVKGSNYLKVSENRPFILSSWEMRKAEGQEESKERKYLDLQPFGCCMLSP